MSGPRLVALVRAGHPRLGSPASSDVLRARLPGMPTSCATASQS